MKSIKQLTSKKIALIGAGISNLTFLHSLKPSDNIQINIFERSKVLSGRAATRKRNDFSFDNGANFFHANDPKIKDIVLNQLSTENLIEIKKKIFKFDSNYNIDYDYENCKQLNEKNKYTYKTGINQLGHLLLGNTKIKYDLQFSKNITKIKQLENSQWKLYSENEDLGNFEYIIFGVPSPNIARVLLNSEFIENDKNFFEESAEVLINSTYKKTYSLSIAFDKSEFDNLNTEFNKFFALVNEKKNSPIVWVCVENEKNKGNLDIYKDNLLLNVQMSNEFSVANQNLPKDEAMKIVIDNLYKLFPILVNKKINFSDLKLWGHSFPGYKLEDNFVKNMGEKNLFIIGDSLLEKGKIEGAMLTGVNLYEKLSAKF